MKRSPGPSSPSALSAGRRPLLIAVAAAVVVAAVAAAWFAIASRPGGDTAASAGGAAASSAAAGGGPTGGAATAASGAVTGGAATATATGGARRYAYLLQPAGRPVARVSLEVAADEPARERGLSRRAEVPAGSGMAFLFPSDTTVAFWMKDTLVPLQIAFVAADGRVVSLFEMAPCRADPCRVYTPTGSYRYAVELPAGAFTAAGVERGDRVIPEDSASLPQAT